MRYRSRSPPLGTTTNRHSPSAKRRDRRRSPIGSRHHYRYNVGCYERSPPKANSFTNRCDDSQLGHGKYAMDGHHISKGIAHSLFTAPSNQVFNYGKLTGNFVSSSQGYLNGSLYRKPLSLINTPSRDIHQEEGRMLCTPRNVSYPTLPVSPSVGRSITPRKQASPARTDICLTLSSGGRYKSNSKFSGPSGYELYGTLPNFVSEIDSKDLINPTDSPGCSRRGYTEAGRREKADSTCPSDELYRMMQPSNQADSGNRVSSRKRSIDLKLDAVNDMKGSHRRLGEGNMWEHRPLREDPVRSCLSSTSKFATTRDVDHSSTGSKYLEFGVRVSGSHPSFPLSGAYGYGMEKAPRMHEHRLNSSLRHECYADMYRSDACPQQSLKMKAVNGYDLLDRVQGRKSSIDKEVPRRNSRNPSSYSGDKVDAVSPQQSSKTKDIDGYDFLDRVQGRKSSIDGEVPRHNSRNPSSYGGDKVDAVSPQQSLKMNDLDGYNLLDRVQGRKSSIDEEVPRHNSRNPSSYSGYTFDAVSPQQSLKMKDVDGYGLLDRVQQRNFIDKEIPRHNSRNPSSNSGDKFDAVSPQQSLKMKDVDRYDLLDRVQQRKFSIDEEVPRHKYRNLSSNSGDVCRKFELADGEEHYGQEDHKALPSYKGSVFSRLEHKKIEGPYNERASKRIESPSNKRASPIIPASQRLLSARGKGFAAKPGTSNGTKKGLKPVSLDLQVPKDHSPSNTKTSHKRKVDDRPSRVDAENDDPTKAKVVPQKFDSPEGSPKFKQLVEKAFLRFSKHLNETSAQRRRYMEQGKAGVLICSICGSPAKEFTDTLSLAAHAYVSSKGNKKAEHLGLHKALCVLMSWNSDFVTGNTWKKQVLPDAEALAQKEDLILWPPLVIIHNSSIGRKYPNEQKVVTVEEMEAILRDLGFSTGMTKVCRGKPANQSIMVVKFMSTFSGLQEAERLHQYYAENKRGRVEFQKMSSGSENSEGAQGDELELVLYGYLGISDDLDKLEIETKKRCVVESKKDILERANASLRFV